MIVEFSNALMDAKHFPRTTIKAQPEFSLSNLQIFGKRLPIENVTTFNRARYALAAAANNLRLTDTANVVLLPAYHCPALVEPFLSQGYQVKFYPQNEDLSTVPDVFKQMLTADITHVVVVRFFGFSQNADMLIKQAFAAGKLVIEDNAHSMAHFWQSCSLNRPEVSASVSSISKTLGTADGGVLFMRGENPRCQQPDFITELKAIVSGIRPAKPMKLANDFRYFKPEMQKEDCLRFSKWLMMRSDYTAISKKRRENYHYLAQKLEHSPAGRLLYPSLADNDVPYVLPFLLNDSRWFSKLREQQIQVLRWEELADLNKQFCVSLREFLIQLPCHQRLSKTELDKIASILL